MRKGSASRIRHEKRQLRSGGGSCLFWWVPPSYFDTLRREERKEEGGSPLLWLQCMLLALLVRLDAYLLNGLLACLYRPVI